MTTPVFFTGLEHGVLSVNGTGLANTLVGTVGTEISIDTSTFRTGLRSLKVSPTATTAGRVVWSVTANAFLTAVFYCNISSVPSSGIARICLVNNTSGANQPQISLEQSSGKFILRTGTTTQATSSASYATGHWYRIELYLDATSNPWIMKCSIDGVEMTASPAIAADTFTGFSVGTSVTAGPAYTAYFDDILVSQTLADYPFGDIQVLAISPVADGTHSPATPDCIRGGGVSPALISGGNTAWQYMDDVPFPSGASPTSDRINQDTSTGAHNTHYVEMTFAAISSIRPVAVTGLLAYGGDSATANTGSTVAINSDNVETAIYGSSSAPADMSETSVFYKRALITAPSGGWTLSNVNLLKMKIGFSNDVTPNPYWQALMFEVAAVASQKFQRASILGV